MSASFKVDVGGDEDASGSPLQQWTLKPSPRKGESEGLFDAEPSFSFGSQSEMELIKDEEGQASSESSEGGGGFLFQRSENSIIDALTPKRRMNGGILRAPDTPGTGQSVRFGKRMYDDGDESKVSDSMSNSDLRSPSKEQMPTRFSVQLSPGALGGTEGDDSAEAVEMSTLSVKRDQYAGDDSSGSLGNLPTMDGYSNLMDEEVGLDESVLNPSFDDDEHKETSSNERVAGIPSSDNVECSPASNQSSHYKMAISSSVRSVRSSPQSDVDIDWSTPKSATTDPGVNEEERLNSSGQSVMEEGSTSDLSIPWSSNNALESPSAARAGRMENSMASLSAIMIPGGLSRRLFDPHAPSPLRNVTQVDSSSSSHKHSTSKSGQEKSGVDEAFAQAAFSTLSSVLDMSSVEDEASIDDILQATQDLDIAHLERTEVLIRRTQHAESEARAALAQAKKEQAASVEAKKEAERLRTTLAQVELDAETGKKRNDERLKEVDMLVTKLREQLDRRTSRSASNDFTSLNVPNLVGVNTDSERMRAEIRSELEQDFELERYAFRRQHDEEIEVLNDKLLQANLELAQRSDIGHGMNIASKGDKSPDVNDDRHALQIKKDDEVSARLTEAENDAQRLLEEKSKSYDELRKESDELRAELQSQWKRSEEAHKRQTSLHEQIQDLESQLATAKEAASEERHQLREEVAQGVFAIEAERQTIGGLKEQAKHAEATIQEKEDRTKEIEGRLATVDKQLATANEGLTRAESLVDSLRSELDVKSESWNEERSSLVEQIDEARREKMAMQELFAAKDQELDQIRHELSAERELIVKLQTEANGLESQCVSVEKELVQAQTRITDLQLEGSTANRGIEAIRRELSGSQNDLIQTRKSLALAEGQLELLHQERSEMLVKMTESEQKARLNESEIDRARDKVALSEQEKEVLLSAISDAEEHHASVVQALQQKLDEQDVQRHSSTTRQSDEQQKVAELLDLAEQMQRRIDESEASQTASRKRIVELEQEVSDRGMTIIKMQKVKERLEADNSSFSIALASKQQELSFLKRRTSLRRTSQTSEATPASSERTAKRMPLQAMQTKAVADDENRQEGEDDTLPALQKGPAHLKATRRKTIDGQVTDDIPPNGARQSRRVTGRTGPVQTSPASKAMPPPASRAYSGKEGDPRAIAAKAARKTSDSSSASSNSLTARKVADPPIVSSSSSSSSAMSSLAGRKSMMSSASSSVSALRGPMDVSELIPTSSVDPASSSALGRSTARHSVSGGSNHERIKQLANIHAPRHSLRRQSTASRHDEGKPMREAQPA